MLLFSLRILRSPDPHIMPVYFPWNMESGFVREENRGSAPRRSSIVLVNSTRLGLSFGFRRLWRLWTIRCNVDFSFWSSREVLLNDFRGLRSYSAWTFGTFWSEVMCPPPWSFNKVPVTKNVSCHFFMFLWNSLWTLTIDLNSANYKTVCAFICGVAILNNDKIYEWKPCLCTTYRQKSRFVEFFFQIKVIVSLYLQPFIPHVQLKYGTFERTTLYFLLMADGWNFCGTFLRSYTKSTFLFLNLDSLLRYRGSKLPQLLHEKSLV